MPTADRQPHERVVLRCAGVIELVLDHGRPDDRTTRLSALPPRFTYVYDFGDNWLHDVEVLGAGGAEPGCVSGEGACLPEECGGVSGYADLLQALGNPRHEEHREMTAWVGDREQRPDWFYGDRPANGEDDSPALWALHELLRRGGVLRHSLCVLKPTKVAGDDRELVRRVRSAYGEDSFDLILAERAVAQIFAHGPTTVGDLAAAVLPWIGDGWRLGSDPIIAADVRRQLADQSADLEGLT